MTRKDLLQTIQDIENGLAMNPTGEILERLTNRLERAKNQLQQLEQKKSDLEQTPASLKHTTNPSLDIPTLYPTPEKIAADARQEERRVENQQRNQEQTARAFAPTIAAPAQSEDIFTIWQNRQGKGQIQVEYTLTELQAEMKRNFTLVFKSAEFAKKGNLMKLLLYCNLIPMYAEMNSAGMEIKMSDLLSGWFQMSMEKKEVAYRLFAAICGCAKLMIEKPGVTSDELAEVTRRIIWG